MSATLPRAGRPEVAVVRHPIADARNTVVGYDLRFGGAVDLGDPAMDAKATSALLIEAFGDIGLDRLAGRHPAWVAIARNFLVEIGPPPVRPDRAVLQIAAYQAKDDLLDKIFGGEPGACGTDPAAGDRVFPGTTVVVEVRNSC